MFFINRIALIKRIRSLIFYKNALNKILDNIGLVLESKVCLK